MRGEGEREAEDDDGGDRESMGMAKTGSPPIYTPLFKRSAYLPYGPDGMVCIKILLLNNLSSMIRQKGKKISTMIPNCLP